MAVSRDNLTGFAANAPETSNLFILQAWAMAMVWHESSGQEWQRQASVMKRLLNIIILAQRLSKCLKKRPD